MSTWGFAPPKILCGLNSFIPSPHVVYLTAHWLQYWYRRGRQIMCAQKCTFFPFASLFVLWREGQGDISIHFVALVLAMFQSPSFQLQHICCSSSWCKACTSLYRMSFFSPLSYLLFFKSLYTIPIQIDVLLWAERIPINLEVVCLVLLIRSILCRRETGKIVTQLKRNLSELQ